MPNPSFGPLAKRFPCPLTHTTFPGNPRVFLTPDVLRGCHPVETDCGDAAALRTDCTDYDHELVLGICVPFEREQWSSSL